MPLSNTAIEIWKICGNCYVAATSAMQALTWYNQQNMMELALEDLEPADPAALVALHNPCSPEQPQYKKAGELVREYLREGGLLPAYVAREAICLR